MISVVGIKAQTISKSVPKNPDPEGIYLFYLHGGIVQNQGANAVSEYYGKYEYHSILVSLKNRGFYIISEVRPKNTDEKEYAIKLKNQMNQLIKLGVSDKNIVIVGASLGAYIALETSLINNNSNIKFVLLGLCSDYAISYFRPFQKQFSGQFLSIYESSDSKGKCINIFQQLNHNSSFEEVQLEMGIDHAFLYKPYQEWIDPLTEWIKY